MNQFSRTELLIGRENVEKLHNAKIAIFGIGGVGSYVVEALARAGVEKFVLIDNDVISLSNINRQLIATHSNIGRSKVDVAKERILEINPRANVEVRKEFFLPESEDFFDGSFSYIIDAIDTVSAKLEIVERAKVHRVPVISCMGTGNKLDPTKFEITDISKTSVCPLAKVMRKELKTRGITHLKVLYSKEEPQILDKEVMEELKKDSDKNNVPASISFVPSVAGLIIAGEVIKDIIGKTEKL